MLQLRLSSRVSALSRLSKVARSSIIRTSINQRCATTAIPAAKTAIKKTLYPERLIIYHSGTGRTVFIGCLKLTTIFICSFFCLIAAPQHFYSEAEPPWVAPIVLISGIVPMVFVAYISGPFVNYIHLRVPAFARNSRELLFRYLQSLPRNAEIDITTMNFIGKPRVSRMRVSELYTTKERFGLANYARVLGKGRVERPWWKGNLPRLFGIHGSRSKIMGGEAWGNVSRCIEKNKKL